MANNRLKTPLINSAILLAVVSLIIYLTVTSPEGSFWGAIGSIFYALFRAVQLVVGLVLALIVCLAVLVGIFFGCIAMVNRDSAARMYRQLKDFGTGNFNRAYALVRGTEVPEAQDIPPAASTGAAGPVSKAEPAGDIHRAQTGLEERLNRLQARVEQNEQDESITKLSDWLREEERKTEEVREAMEQLAEQVGKLREEVDGIAAKISADDAGRDLQELRSQVEKLASGEGGRDTAVSTLQEKIDAIQKELKEVRAALAESEAGGEGTGEHRLFNYIENEQEREKILKLVAEATEGEMTYAQATDHIVANVSPDTAKIIAEHPALTKELLREHRKQD